MIFSLDVRRARKGDCLLLHWGTREDPGLMLIDGGPAAVYGPELKPRIKKIRQARELPPTDALPVDVLVVSHIDDDHIHGILDMTDELIMAMDAQNPALTKIFGCWHNTFDDIIGNTPEELRASITAQFGVAAFDGEPPEGAELEFDSAKVLASVGQGHRLRDDTRKLGISINTDFGGGLILNQGSADKLDLDRGLEIAVVGPMRPELEALQKRHDDWLQKNKVKRSSPEAALAAFADTAVPNLSSIVLLAEAGGKRMLLTGDARGDKILKGLESAGLLPAGGTIHVDLLKVPHHGSARNMETVFFERVKADHYVFSGNGEHGNPGRETLEMLFEARGDQGFVMHFTYPIEYIDSERAKDWEKERRKGRRNRDWSPADDSLQALFASHDLSSAGQKILCVDKRKPHVVDLLEPLAF